MTALLKQSPTDRAVRISNPEHDTDRLRPSGGLEVTRLAIPASFAHGPRQGALLHSPDADQAAGNQYQQPAPENCQDYSESEDDCCGNSDTNGLTRSEAVLACRLHSMICRLIVFYD
jgi:hypothetical protein